MLIRIERGSRKNGVESLSREAEVIDKPGFLFFCSDREELAQSSLLDDAERVLRRIKVA